MHQAGLLREEAYEENGEATRTLYDSWFARNTRMAPARSIKPNTKTVVSKMLEEGWCKTHPSAGRGLAVHGSPRPRYSTSRASRGAEWGLLASNPADRVTNDHAQGTEGAPPSDGPGRGGPPS